MSEHLLEILHFNDVYEIAEKKVDETKGEKGIKIDNTEP
jgi:hypothetical protein